MHFVEHAPDLLIKLTGAWELGSEEVDWIAAVNKKENSIIKEHCKQQYH